MVAYLPEYEHDEQQGQLTPSIPPFAGRMGGNQDFIVDRNDPRNEKVLEKVPDAAPCMTLQEVFDFRGFLSADLWKFALLECVASMMNVFITAWVTTHAPSSDGAPKSQAGIYATLTFFSPLFGGITNLLLTPLLIYTFSPSSGGHISPTITLATFFARIISFPRMVLYLVGQTLGGALAGFALNSAYGTRNFTVGGCYIDTGLVPVKDALIIEFMACLILIFLAFGVALDPRQAKVFGHATAPWFVGVVLGVVTWGTAWTRDGYIGASVNPARCFGAYVASSFPGYHWIHWVGPLAAAVAHGLVYFIDPLWKDPRSTPSS
ncbi:aquaporin-like protein [Aspergillus steynii IBT 23096]|uniref:Aquaporin-like protein n=1 Tax=Aspergillus steynii IBT 23096 TaxID=1392250 RepID=A0A2I2G6Z9_9EURO|nr:aquaporin-like protein [Aspergillus steynii IBT 23096]PLB48635.1 aquaporin-like protein [Aspergillus steynii IBT 23096]